MSSTRLALSFVTLALVVATGATAQVPSTDVGPVEKQAKAVTPENPIPRRFHSVDPLYPAEAAAIGASARVTIRAVLDEFGRVVEVRQLTLPVVTPSRQSPTDAEALKVATEALLRSSAEAVRQWQYESPKDGPLAFNVTFRFGPATVSFVAQEAVAVSETVTVLGGAAPRQPPPPPSTPGSPTGTATPSGPAATGAPVRVGSGIRAPQQVYRASPVYPPDALAARVQGVVILEAVIGPDGRVSDARVLRSIPLLDQAAVDAVRQWQYAPTMLNGAAVPVIMTVTVQFTLS